MSLAENSRRWLSRILLGTAIATSIGAASGCSSESDQSGTDDEDVVLGPGGRFGPSLFRNDFYTYLTRDGHYSAEQVRQLVLMPTESAVNPKAAIDPKAPLTGYDAAYAKMRPTDFYNQGLITPLSMRIGPGGPLEAELRRNRVHIVIVPGIFGEFIPVAPFEEVFRYGGSASLEWDRKMKKLEADPSSAALIQDKQFSALAVKDVDRSMRDLVRVGSIDDTDGTPLVTITYLKPEIGSLETFGTLDENTDYYLPRLEKYFRIIGVPEHLYVMGYSRGTATALNLVSRAEAEHASWAPRLKGVIALAGVIYGTQLADAALADGAQKQMLDTMADFVQNQLESCTEAAPGAWLMTKNLGHWTAFLAREASAAYGMPNHKEELAREGIDTANANLGSIASFARRILFGDSQRVFSSEGTDDSSISGVLHMNAPNAEYCQNIERFKKTATQIMKGVATLTTPSRLDWFHTHTLPSHVRYYALTGTMGDATPAGGQVSPLVKNTTAYDVHSLDFSSLRGNYYDLFAASTHQLQDSQVPVQRARFWPELHSTLNPAQKPLKTYFMGTVGAHHWGLSFPRAFSTKDGLEANPYPRTLLLKSIGTFVAQVESRPADR